MDSAFIVPMASSFLRVRMTLSKPMIFSEPALVWTAARVMVVEASPSLWKGRETCCQACMFSSEGRVSVEPPSVDTLIMASPPRPLFHTSAESV